MALEPADIYDHEGFPVLDFKFENPGLRHELITRVHVIATKATIDPTPSLEYSLECDDGNLALFVYNYGWGDARAFNGNVDLSAFEGALRNHNVAVTANTIPSIELDAQDKLLGYTPPVTEVSSKYDPSRKFVLVRRDEVNPALLPAGMSWSPTPQSRGLGGPISTRISDLRSTFEYRSEVGESLADAIELSRIERGIYDWKNILYVKDHFEYVPYNLGISYYAAEPTAQYHFMIDPNKVPNVYERSVAHVIDSGDYERIWLVVGCTKSANVELEIAFATAGGQRMSSGPISLNIWRPKNAIRAEEADNFMLHTQTDDNTFRPFKVPPW